MSHSTDHLLRGTLELLLLKAVSQAPLHGYGIARRIEVATGDALSVEEGSLYPALHRLEERGLVSGRWSTNETGRRVRVYSLTRKGRLRLAEQRQQWTTFARAVARMVESD